MDELDQKIVSQLSVDGRLTKLEIARRLGVTETTVRKRINRLVQDGIINIVALTNPYKFGRAVDAFIGVSARIDRVGVVVQELAAMEEVRYAGLVSGRHDIMIVASFPSHDELADFLIDRLAKLPGVVRTETFQILRVVKRAYEFPKVVVRDVLGENKT